MSSCGDIMLLVHIWAGKFISTEILKHELFLFLNVVKL